MTVMYEAPYTPQGDLNIFDVEEIPEGLQEAIPEKDGNHVLAHSETGHHHVIDGNCARVFNEENEFISYLDVKEETNVVHLKDYDTHESIRLKVGKYKITRQREYIAEGFRRAAD